MEEIELTERQRALIVSCIFQIRISKIPMGKGVDEELEEILKKLLDKEF